MTLDEIINHNKVLAQEIREKEEKISELRAQINDIKFELVPPCRFCPYDGEWRCQTCQEECFGGFNVKEYPKYD